MPSLWDLLCVSRQKYTTHGDSGKSPPHHRMMDNKGDVEYYIQPQHHFQRELQRDSLSWFASGGRHSRTTSVSQTDGRGNDSGSVISSLMDRSAGDRTYEKKRRTPHARQLSGVSNERRRKQAESDERKKKKQEAVIAGRRRHVQDIFVDNHEPGFRSRNTSSASLTSSHSAHSNRSQQKSVDKPRRSRQRDSGVNRQPQSDLPGRTRRQSSKDSLGFDIHNDSMYQYTPRSVDDKAISAALFGQTQDDFVHDPAWNRAMDRFAASPATTSNSSFAFSEQNSHRAPSSGVPSPAGQSPAGFYGNTSRRQSEQDSRSPDWGRAFQRVASQGSDGNLMYVVPEVTPPSPRSRGATGSVSTHSGIVLTSSMLGVPSDTNTEAADTSAGAADRNHNSVFTDLLHMQGNDSADGIQFSEGINPDVERLFCSGGDVLY
ncbi:uncharacterized protein [Littorina saxatilis]|uniref:uncharacterized protein n=1 Tax=Littorina saxatilis TaxID=31220 RepID=UPI0038B547FA